MKSSTLENNNIPFQNIEFKEPKQPCFFDKIPNVDVRFIETYTTLTTSNNLDDYEVCYSVKSEDYLSCYLEKHIEETKRTDFYIIQVIKEKKTGMIFYYTRIGTVGVDGSRNVVKYEQFEKAEEKY